MQLNSQTPGNFFPNKNDQDPYQVIADFFDIYSLSDVRKRISGWMEAVCKKEQWRERYPSNLNFFYKKLVKLIDAVHQIYREQKRHQTATALLKEKGYDIETNLLHPALYFGWGQHENIWTDFPRDLSLEEYVDPYLVFPPFFTLYDPAAWRQGLYKLLLAVRSGHSPADISDQKKKLLLIQKELLKLVEAAHLIDVREVAYKGEFRKRYPFTLSWPCSDLSITRVLKVRISEENGRKLPGDERPIVNNKHAPEDNRQGDDSTEACKKDDCMDKYDGDNDGNHEKCADGGRVLTCRRDILARVLDGHPKNVHINIRGNYVVNHPPGREGGEDR